MAVKTGDQFLTENNQRYETINVSKNIANARFIGKVELSGYAPADRKSLLAKLFGSAISFAQDQGTVAIYHTHSDESYVPTDGKESIQGNGGIYETGDAFTTALQNKGLKVIHSMTRH